MLLDSTSWLESQQPAEASKAQVVLIHLSLSTAQCLLTPPHKDEGRESYNVDFSLTEKRSQCLFGC
ncbi:hypothetical protein NQZ68_013605 [Dissostichus eleginoides]|nr:hypothetical protein NQZ68_013605 [Dissostichus eleginoides]